VAKETFLDELTGDFVRHLRTAPQVIVGGLTIPAIADMVGIADDARVFPEAARFGVDMPQIVYTQVSGHSPKDHDGRDGCEDLTLHVYAYAVQQPRSRLLARAILERCVNDHGLRWGLDTFLHVCNGGVIDSGVHHANDQSDIKSFWSRLVLRLVISNA